MKKKKYDHNFLDPENGNDYEEEEFDFSRKGSRKKYFDRLSTHLLEYSSFGGTESWWDLYSVDKADAYSNITVSNDYNNLVLFYSEDDTKTKVAIISFDAERERVLVSFSFLASPYMVAYLSVLLANLHPLIVRDNFFQKDSRLYYGESARINFCKYVSEDYTANIKRELTIPEGEIKH